MLPVDAGIIIVALAGFGCAGVTDHGGTTEAAKYFSCEEIISDAMLNMAGSFLFHALRLLKFSFADDGGNAAGGADVSPDINAGISFIGNDPQDALGRPAASTGS